MGRRAVLATQDHPDPRALSRLIRSRGMALAGRPHQQCYAFHDPKAAENRGFPSKSENPTGTLNQDDFKSLPAPAITSDSPLERALARFGAVIEGRLLANGSGGTVEAV